MLFILSQLFHLEATTSCFSLAVDVLIGYILFGVYRDMKNEEIKSLRKELEAR